MARFIYHRLCRLWDCMSRGFLFYFHRVIFTRFRALGGYFRLALGGGSGDENEDAPSSTETVGGLCGVETEPKPRGWSPEQGSVWGTSSGKERPAEGFEGGARQQRYGENAAWMTEEEEEETVTVGETTDEIYCSYDSTWETEEDGRDKAASRPLTSFKSNKLRRFENAARDMQNYRRGYPNKLPRGPRPSFDDMPNYNFYLGMTQSQPDGMLITDFHEKWFGEYDALEYVHTYIQWLFPLQEPGLNNEAAPLTKEEIECFLRNPTAKESLLKSYELMLDFYGIKFSNKQKGEVQKSSNWEERFRNLNAHTHNNLRITRILKCLGTLGLPQYQAPLVLFFLTETLVEGRLPNVKESVLNYFVFAVLDKESRRDLIKFAFLNYDGDDEFVWCPKKLQRRWAREAVKEKSWTH